MPALPSLEFAGELYRQARYPEALAAIAAILRADPAHASAHFQAGLTHYATGQWAEGVAHLRVAVASDPGFAQGWINLAFGLHALARGGAARKAIDRALALRPDLAEAWNTLGVIEMEARDFASARERFGQALALQPGFALALMNVANCDRALGRMAEAKSEYEEALALAPQLPELHYNLGHFEHTVTGEYRDAERRYREAIRLRADYAIAHHHLAHVLFLLGRRAEAWPEYAWRAPRLQYSGAIARAGGHYQPGALGGTTKRLAVIGEQGLGDVLFLLRFAALLRARPIELEFIGDARLHSMLARTGLFDAFAASGDAPPGTIAVLAGDLALLLPERMGETPPPLALTPDAAKLDAIRRRLAALGAPPYVALAWRAGDARPGPYETLFKQLPVAPFADALRGIDATWICVQRQPRPGETEALAARIGAPVHDFSSVNLDLEEALATMTAVDAYAGVSSTNVHLRAASGKPAQILVPFPYEWRWMASGPSPWFPGVGVHRQQSNGDWSGALEAMALELRASLPRR